MIVASLPLLLATALQSAPSASPGSPEASGAAPLRQIAIDLARHPDLNWRTSGLDIYLAPRGEGGVLRVLADDDDLGRLAARGVTWTLVQEDQAAFYASRLKQGGFPVLGGQGSWVVPPFGGGSMGGYYTFSEIVSVIDQIAAAYPNIVAPKQSIGQSFQGRELWMLKVSDNPGTDEDEPEVRIDTLHHSREPQGMQTSIWFLLWLVENYGTDPLATYIVDEREIYFIPCVNPDGYVWNETTDPNGGGLWRKNRRPVGGDVGIDLNRNYPFEWGHDNEGSSPFPGDETYRGPSPASEPETQAMVAFFGQRNFRTALSVHTFSDLWLSPYGYDFIPPENAAEYSQLETLATAVNAYEAGPASLVLYLANGVTMDYDHASHDTMCWTPEIGGLADGFWPPSTQIVPLAEENLLAFQRTALGAGSFIYVEPVTVTEVGDGDGTFEPGEGASFALDLQNSGRDAAGTAVIATLTVEGSDATVTNGSFDFGAMSPFSTADTGGSPLALQILPSAPDSGGIAYTITIEHEGLIQEFPGFLPIGTPRPFLRDNVETDLGWTTGEPTDTASTGLWERANPIGTDSSGEPASPENDATPGAGTQCFTTGNGGGSAGNDDVDDGLTTLITPRIDLSDVGPAVVRYSRWFADLSTEDDIFRISISNDDGATWVPLESVTGNQNSWIEVEHLIPAVLPQTDAMRLRFIAEDDPNNSVLEAAIDELEIDIYDAEPRLNVFGKPEVGGSLALHVAGDAAAPYAAFFSLSTASITLPGFTGTGQLDPAGALPLVSSSIPSGGLEQVIINLPSTPSTAGTTVFVQAVVLGAQPGFTNLGTFTIE